MSHIFVHSEHIIDASPAEVYETIIDYKEKRPRILTPNFLDYTVEQGGHGDGTVISYRLRAANRERLYRMRVEEVVKGQTVAEYDSNSSLVTRWIVLPLSGGEKSRVSIETEWEGGSGIGGFFERTFAPMGLRKIYNDMLEMLMLVVQSPEQSRQASLFESDKDTGSKAGTYALIIGAVAAIIYGIGYLRKKQG